MEKYASQGLRVLGFAIKPDFDNETLEHKDVQKNLIFIGLQAMIDPPRSDAAAAIESCRKAAIGVKMISVDNLVTAKTIAAKINIYGFII